MSAPEKLYRLFVEQGISEEEQRFIHDRVQCNSLTGGSAFTDEIELRTGLRIEHRLPGRPKKQKNKIAPIHSTYAGWDVDCFDSQSTRATGSV